MRHDTAVHTEADWKGMPRADDRTTLNGALYILSMGCRWDDLSNTQERMYRTH
ncbi:MAG: hypothetical protein PXY39_13590 [archaeon]|nr:hypothetical protein [archaeon]